MPRASISIVAVNYNSEDWARLLVKSVRETEADPHEIIIIDNSQNLPDIDGVKIMRPQVNWGHGTGLDYGILNAEGEYALCLDIDAHLLDKGWEDALLSKMESDKSLMLIGAEGDSLKPYRPCVSFIKKDFFIKGGHSYEAVPVHAKGGFMTIDVGVYMAMRLLHDGHKAYPLKVGDGAYKDVTGDTYYLDGKRIAYHNWYGTRFTDGPEVIDGIRRQDVLDAKARLFKQIYG